MRRAWSRRSVRCGPPRAASRGAHRLRPTRTTAAMLGLTAVLVAATAHAEMPAFQAACPQGHVVRADAAGTVRVDGVVARVERFNPQYTEATVAGITYTIGTAADGTGLQVGDNRPGSAGGYCTIVSASAASDPSASATGAADVPVTFDPGTSGAELTGSLAPGESRRYRLGARDGQDLYARVAPNEGALEYQIFNPDGSFLLDRISADQPYRGQLWQSGDHVVEVINRSNSTVSYHVIFGID